MSARKVSGEFRQLLGISDLALPICFDRALAQSKQNEKIATAAAPNAKQLLNLEETFLAY